MPIRKSRLDQRTYRWRSTPELWLVVWGVPLNGAWEFLHSPLYSDHSKGWWYIVWTRLHCTIGDLMILLACFWITSLLFRSRSWVETLNWTAVATFILLGLGYTLFSEWYNTAVATTWQYTKSMPTLLGIGLSPIAQWMVVPAIVVIAVHRHCTRCADSQ